MGSKRGDPVLRPNPWTFIFGDRQAGEGWEQLKKSAGNAADEAWVAITSNPKRTDQRQHQLKGSQATGMFQGKSLPKWQYEVTRAGRVWYLVDDDTRTLVMVQASTGHPGATDKGKVRRR